jgi:colanic acid/amylovoran biosynthesis glycosyltransferase
MKIIYLTRSFPYTEVEAFLTPEISSLTRRGHEVLIIPRSPRNFVVHGDAQPMLGMTKTQPLVSLEIIKAAGVEMCRRPVKALKALTMLLRSRNARALGGNLAVFTKGLWLARVARKWGASHIHAHWATYTSTMALVASELSEIPWSFTAHRHDIVLNNLLALKMKKATFGRFISQSGLDLARGLAPKGSQEKVLLLHMGVDLPAVPTPMEQRRTNCVILCPANLLPVKGHKYLIEAIEILQRQGVEVSLWLAGEGELRQSLQKQVDRAGLSNHVRFLGQLSHTDVLRFYAEAMVDIVVLPSVDLGNGLHEGIPVALIEPMSYGIPVVSTTTGGVPELILEGTGLLVPPQDAFSMANAIDRLINNPELRKQIAAAGRRRVENSFAVEEIVTHLAACFESAEMAGSKEKEREKTYVTAFPLHDRQP